MLYSLAHLLNQVLQIAFQVDDFRRAVFLDDVVLVVDRVYEQLDELLAVVLVGVVEYPTA